ncbi:MAG: cupin domain-containing protein [Candidatus Nitrosocosmicus sp.]
MDSIIDTDSILSKLEKKGENTYFLDFLHTNSFDAGLLRLNPGETDTQGSHSADEIYFVIEGEGYIEIRDKSHRIKKGSCVFIPSKTKHHFHGNSDRLVVLYIFNNNG